MKTTKFKKFTWRKLDVSIIVPTYNEEGNIESLITRINNTLVKANIHYELIFIDDHSTDNTLNKINIYINKFPIRYFLKKGQQGKAQSIIEGVNFAKSDLITMIDADLQYPPENIPNMLKKIRDGADIVVGNRKQQHTNMLRKITHHGFMFVFGKLLHGFDCDVQSGLKVFKKEILMRIDLNPTPWTFDLEFLIKATHADYKINTIDIVFEKRFSGNSKLPILKSIYEIGIGAVKLKLQSPQIINFSNKMSKKNGNGFHLKGKKYVTHNLLATKDSAVFTLTHNQLLIILLMALFLVISFIINWHATLVVFLGIITFLYFSDIIFNFYLIYRSFKINPEIKITDAELQQNTAWPIYTILCPLYKEWQILPQFIKGISNLNYPKNKLQVLLLLEEDDKTSTEKISKIKLPSFFKTLVVPNSIPKTKPKACNYGLKFAKGEYVVIYDAEDIPETDQLKKAVLAFKKVTEKLFCFQAKLNFYNPKQNILTKLFTSEYSLWFDLILPGLQSINTTIPLGGTSNHFRTKQLQKMQGWDAFNVTEDCDLGIRLVKHGYKTAVLDSTTFEEANSELKNWFWQRTRWIKGYIQTYLVHMRSPHTFMTLEQKFHLWAFQLVVGGKVLSTLVNPLMWLITILYFALRVKLGPVIESFYPTPVFYMGVFSLVFGNFLYLYYYMIGLAKREYYDLIKYTFIVPFYWLSMSIAAWVAVYKLIMQPHHWSKTLHGFHLQELNSVKKIPVIVSNKITQPATY